MVDPTGIFIQQQPCRGTLTEYTEFRTEYYNYCFENIYFIFGSQARLSLFLECVNRNFFAVYLPPLQPHMQLLDQAQCCNDANVESKKLSLFLLSNFMYCL